MDFSRLDKVAKDLTETVERMCDKIKKYFGEEVSPRDEKTIRDYVGVFSAVNDNLRDTETETLDDLEE